MADPILGANTEIDSPSTSATGATSQSQQGANNGQFTTETKSESISDVVKRIKEKHNIDSKEGKAAESPTAGQEENGGILKSNSTEEEKTKEGLEQEPSLKDKEKKTEEVVEDSKTTTDDSKLPFHNHPRFKQVIKERKEFEEKLTTTTQELEQHKPVADRMRIVEEYCTKNNIPPQDYDESLRLAALVRNSPKEAITKLESLVEQLKISTGDSLPKDLQTEVDNGNLSLTHAQEMAKLRLQAKGAEHQVKLTQQSSAQRQQQQLVQSLDAWTQSKIKLDPSFKPKQSGQDDGKYELVTDRFLALWNQSPPQSVEDAVKLADKAYGSVHQFIERTIPKPAVRRPLNSKTPVQQSDKPVDTSKPGWAREVARRTLAAREN